MKIAIAGVWHVHATQYTNVAQKYGEVVGVYDDNAKWASDFAEKHSIPLFNSYEELLESDADGVIFCTATNKHTEMIVRAAKAGKHIFTEKVLALDEAGCDNIIKAVDENKVKFIISYPWKFNSGIMALKKAVDEGKIGEINYLRFRNCHSGSIQHWLPAHFYNKEECGGGAMIDLGAHGMYLTHWFLGEPDDYNSTFTHYCRDEKDAIFNPDGVEDNAITVMSYKNGAIAVNETGFVSKGSPTKLEIGGNEGYLHFDGKTATLNQGDGFVELELPKTTTDPITAFVKGEEIDGCGLEEAKVLTRMMLKAYKHIR